jgi:hypothetical protein
MNRFVLKNTFIKIYIYHFLINIFTKIRSQCYALKIVSLSKMTLFFSIDRVYVSLEVDKHHQEFLGGCCMPVLKKIFSTQGKSGLCSQIGASKGPSSIALCTLVLFGSIHTWC